MLRIDRKARRLAQLTRRAMPEAGLREREDLQRMIQSDPEAFFAEMGEELLLIGEEVRPTQVVDDRIDLLAVDPEGAATIIELKRRDHKLHLLQALAYSAMVSKWKPERFVEERMRLTSKPRAEVEEEIEQHLTEDFGTLNQRQRVVLIAEGFDWEVLATSEWLSEKHDVDVRCYRLGLAVDGDAEYLTCTCIFPPPELTEHAIRRRGGEQREARWKSWDEAIGAIANPAIQAFFKREVGAGREHYLRKRILHYRIAGRRAFSVSARRKNAYVWQNGRFPGDVEFWTQKLRDNANIKPVKGGRRLRFFLESSDQLGQFESAVRSNLGGLTFADDPGNETDDETED